jgi:hypothetical protein
MSLTQEEQSFVKKYLPWAESAARLLNWNPLAILAQWALETGWGASVLVASNNLAGIEAPVGFRAYPNLAAFVRDYTTILLRDTPALQNPHNYDATPKEILSTSIYNSSDPLQQEQYADEVNAVFLMLASAYPQYLKTQKDDSKETVVLPVTFLANSYQVGLPEGIAVNGIRIKDNVLFSEGIFGLEIGGLSLPNPIALPQHVDVVKQDIEEWQYGVVELVLYQSEDEVGMRFTAVEAVINPYSSVCIISTKLFIERDIIYTVNPVAKKLTLVR